MIIKMSRERIIAACGNDCSMCPRYTKEPYVKTKEEYETIRKAFFEKEKNLKNSLVSENEFD